MLTNILLKKFQVWRFLYISHSFGNMFGLLGWDVDMHGKITSLFFSFSLLSYSWGTARAFLIPSSTTNFEYCWVFKIIISSLSFMYLTFLFSTVMQMHFARQNSLFFVNKTENEWCSHMFIYVHIYYKAPPTPAYLLYLEY